MKQNTLQKSTSCRKVIFNYQETTMKQLLCSSIVLVIIFACKLHAIVEILRGGKK